MKDKILYHYCTLDKFEKIIRTQTLRFCDIRQSNDSEELLFLIDFYDRVTKPRNVLGFNPNRFFLEQNLQYDKYYTFCLSKKADDLSQWRGYAPNGGIAIGFSESSLRELAKSIRIGFEVSSLREANCVDVKYISLTKPQKLSRQYLELCDQMLRIKNDFQENLEKGEKTPLPIEELSKICVEYKNKEFKAESECRLFFQIKKNNLEQFERVYLNDKEINKESFGYAIPFDLSMIKRIIIGPKVNFLGQKEGLRDAVLSFLKESAKECDYGQLHISKRNIILTKLSYR